MMLLMSLDSLDVSLCHVSSHIVHTSNIICTY